MFFYDESEPMIRNPAPSTLVPARRFALLPTLTLTLAVSTLFGCSKAAETTAPSASTAGQVATTAGPSGSAQTTASTAGTATSRPRGTTSTTETDEATSTTEPTASGTTVDLGGLSVVVPADAPVPDPESGVTLIAGSVYGLPGESFDELADIDATNRVVTSTDGKPVIIYLFGSDTLFDVGSSTVKTTAEAALPGVIASIGKRAPKAKILVRGFTDSSGTAAANQTLSEERAASVTAWLAANGIDRGRITASGYGSTHPAAEETSDDGTALNRRIEIIAVG